MKNLHLEYPVDEHLKPIKTDETNTSLEISTDKIRVKDLEVTGTSILDDTTKLPLAGGTMTGDLNIASGDKLTFDGGGDTYIHEVAGDVVRHYVGNEIFLTLDEATGTSNKAISIGASVGFTQREPTYNATNTPVDFSITNKLFLTFGSGNITNVNLKFPVICSGNFVLLLKQDGTGSRTVTTWKTADQAEGNAGEVIWSGGSAPTLTTTGNKLDILSFYWDNNNHKAYGVASTNF